MAEILTPQQEAAVWNRGGKLLVSAAAGSGKTKVLVDRLLGYLMDPEHSANIDDFLIITYTKAAASELRGKIAAKLSERISENPSNRHLQQQMQRLYLAKISTVHSYCADLLREYAYLMDIPGDFRVADENEVRQLQSQAMEYILEEAYSKASRDSQFLAFINTQGFGRDDRQIPDILLSVYQSARCHLSPDTWLGWCVDTAQPDGIDDAADTVWGSYLLQDLRQYLAMQIQALERCICASDGVEGMEKPLNLLQTTVQQLRHLAEAQTWDEVVDRKQIDYGTLRFSKSCKNMELAERIKAIRNACKSGVEKKLRNFASASHQVLSELSDVSCAVQGMVALVNSFSKEYERLKRLRHILDFGDLEHKTLDLLLGKSRSGPTQISAQIAQRYLEIMVDEYQDSNAVQDAIFEVLTQKRNNCFMVGDVKQSIYQFRLADPSIFIEKYNTYAPAEDAAVGMGRKIQLSHNFRSSGGVISAVNAVFEQCMSAEVGGLDYTDEEMLREGVPHLPLDEPEVELYGIDVQEDTYAEEAAFVAKKIESLLDGSHMIRKNGQLQPIQPEDIVILLRSPNSVKGDFLYALEQRGVPCTAGDSADLLQTEEVTVLRSLLSVISNPLQDIPLVSVLASRIFQFTASELAEIRGRDRRHSLYECLCKQQSEKCKQFVSQLKILRDEARFYNVSELLQRIFLRTSMDSLYAAMGDGDEKKRNLNQFCQLAAQFEANGSKDLAQFLEHLQILDENGMASINQSGNGDSVTIMSIHKSKGLEFPVVFLCGLSRSFNQEGSRAPVLCHKDLGLGLCCLDDKNRVRYSSVAKKAIAGKIQAESISEELRVLYVAMTRPKDRLIMTYAVKNLEKDLADIALRSDFTPPLLLSSSVDCPGLWVLMSAMRRTEAGAFFQLAGRPDNVSFQEPVWGIRVVSEKTSPCSTAEEVIAINHLPEETATQLRDSLSFAYRHTDATKTPSKLTATQMKGRLKDQEAAEHSWDRKAYSCYFRKPSFIQQSAGGAERGTAMHTLLQHIRYDACDDFDSVHSEIRRLLDQGLLTEKQAQLLEPEKIVKLFEEPIGQRIKACNHVLREFKFSVLQNLGGFGKLDPDEKILIQGVIDCALLEEDGITVIDFKTDHVTKDTMETVVDLYKEQVSVYAGAVSEIYQKPIKACYLYLFALDLFVEVDIT